VAEPVHAVVGRSARTRCPASAIHTLRLLRNITCSNDSSVQAVVINLLRPRRSLDRLNLECHIRAGSVSVEADGVATRLTQAMR